MAGGEKTKTKELESVDGIGMGSRGWMDGNEDEWLGVRR